MIAATNNLGKLKEIREILKEYKIYSLREMGINVDVDEDGKTFLENAKKKAIEIYKIAQSNEGVIADDSGLCIKVLNGFPGVETHRFLGEDATDKMRNEYLINQVNKYNDRSAQFICNLVYYDGTNITVGEGILEGFISRKCRGENGFGFDQIFELPNGLTLAELSSEEKNSISARSLALKDLKRKLKNSVDCNYVERSNRTT